MTVADRHTRGVIYDQEWALTLTATQVHATLALAAATAVGTTGPDGYAWADVAATRLSARRLDLPPIALRGPVLRRPPPLFAPEDRPRHYAGAL
jgi:hypothetical protein